MLLGLAQQLNLLPTVLGTCGNVFNSDANAHSSLSFSTAVVVLRSIIQWLALQDQDDTMPRLHWHHRCDTRACVPGCAER
jgi:hypothetical protein